jgi:hypothetical protein
MSMSDLSGDRDEGCEISYRESSPAFSLSPAVVIDTREFTRAAMFDLAGIARSDNLIDR